ncbi:hypothetical protein ZWY2020_047761 [Hordeum vulgare]|nr:hypothetical protein ZWY2020_047761 [Hordeum vulgare]
MMLLVSFFSSIEAAPTAPGLADGIINSIHNAGLADGIINSGIMKRRNLHSTISPLPTNARWLLKLQK